MIYDHLCVDPVDKDKITDLLVDCFIMGKKMSDRLHYYQNTYKDMTGSRGNNLPGFGDRRGRRIRRKVREGWKQPQ